MKKTVKTILVVLVLSVLLILGYKYFFKGQTTNFVIGSNSTDIVINATTAKSNQTLTINKYFSNDFTVDRWDWSKKEILKSSDDYIRDWQIYPTKVRHTYRNKWSYNIVLSLTHWDKRRKFQNVRTPLIENILEDESDPWGESIIESFEWNVSIISMPSLADWFGESKEEPWDYFFANFNYGWAIIWLPKWSFDTSNIKKAWNDFFAWFGCKNLPKWSFDISNITIVWDSFFAYFWASELPEWSFDTSNIITVWNWFFQYFNNYWKLTKLPKWSFNLSKITTVWNSFFYNFNYDWSLMELPEWSFYFPNITEVWYGFFTSFNERWDLIKLPEWSFDLSNITTVWDNFFQYFNHAWAIEKLPEGSFDISNIRKKGKNFFKDFNSFNWKLSDAPDFENIRKNQIWEISYDKNSKTNIVINITVVQANQKITINKYFSNDYNVDWWDGLIEWLTEDKTHTYEKVWTYDIILSLREWAERWMFQGWYKPLISKNLTSIKEIKITSMPSLAEWFGESETEPWDNFFAYFNYWWAITELPKWSFDTSWIKVAWDGFFTYFNSKWALTELPEWSFDTSNIKIVWDRFLGWFNYEWNLTDLPDWSFNISNIERTWISFLNQFNWGWAPKSLIGSTTTWWGKILKQELGKYYVDVCVNKIKEYVWKDPVEIFTGNNAGWQIKCHTTPLLITGEYYLQQTCEDNQQLCWLFCYNSWADIVEHFATCGYDINNGELINFYRDDQNNKTGLFEKGWDKRFSTTEGRIWLCNQCSGLPEWRSWDWFQEIVGSNSYIYSAWQETYNRTQCQIYFDGGKVTVGNKVCFPWLNQDSSDFEKNNWWVGSVSDSSWLNENTKEKRYFFYNTCVEDIKQHIRKNLGITWNIVEVVYSSSNAPRGTDLLILPWYYYIVRDYGRMGWALYYKDAWIIIKQEDMSCEYDLDGNLTKLNYNPDRTDLLKKLWDDRYLTTEGRLSLCNAKIKKNWTMEILKPDYYTYVEIESRWITSWSWKTECRIHFDDGKIEIIDHMAEMNKPMQLQ